MTRRCEHGALTHAADGTAAVVYCAAPAVTTRHRTVTHHLCAAHALALDLDSARRKLTSFERPTLNSDEIAALIAEGQAAA